MNGWTIRPRESDPGVPLPAGPVPGFAAILNPAPEPEAPAEPAVICKVISAFCFGRDETGQVVDLVVGDLRQIEGRRARELQRKGFVEIIVDRKAETEARASAMRTKLEAAKRAAALEAAPPPAQPPLPEPQGELVTIRTLKSFCLGAGVDVEAGVTMKMNIDDATRRVRAGLVEVVEPEPGA